MLQAGEVGLGDDRQVVSVQVAGEKRKTHGAAVRGHGVTGAMSVHYNQ